MHATDKDRGGRDANKRVISSIDIANAMYGGKEIPEEKMDAAVATIVSTRTKPDFLT